MTNGIAHDVNDLLSFALSLSGYVENSSAWTLGRSKTDADNLLRRVPPTLSFAADVVLPGSRVAFGFQLRGDPLRVPPRVTTNAPWLRRRVQWHVYPDGGICWAYPPHYCAMIEELSLHLDRPALLDTAACWCVTKSAEVVQHHLEAEKCALKEWPPHWDAWPHSYNEAQALFENMKRQGKFATEVRQLLAAR
jgi:hypothetical protein